MSTEQQSQATRVWDDFLAQMSPTVQAAFRREPAAVEVDADDDSALADLGPLARQGLEGLSEKPQVEEIDASIAKFHLVECADGEWATVSTFKVPEGMVRRLADLEGQDTNVWAFYGVPLIISRGPQRYVCLPDGKHAMTVPPYAGGPVKIVDITLLTGIKPQDDGYMGPPELAVVHIERVPPKPKHVRRGPMGDDDEDDEDDEEGLEVE